MIEIKEIINCNNVLYQYVTTITIGELLSNMLSEGNIDFNTYIKLANISEEDKFEELAKIYKRKERLNEHKTIQSIRNI